jgi:hypothetical protein
MRQVFLVRSLVATSHLRVQDWISIDLAIDVQASAATRTLPAAERKR